MTSKENDNRQLVRWERFLALFREEISKPSETRPTVRYWKSSDLVRTICKISQQNRTELLTTFPTGEVALARLEKIGWVGLVPIIWGKSKKGNQKMYQVSLYEDDAITTDPLELLQGYQPQGIICYLGALQHHELTTQIPPFYHITRTRSGPIPTYNADKSILKPKELSAKAHSPMGTALFTLGELQFYETSRYAALMPGVQVRLLSSRSGLRITDPEQTLLDTLTHPLQCGGSAIVFEAWERAADRIDTSRLLAHLNVINRAPLWRRAAAMLSLMQISENDSTLTEAFEKKRAIMDNPSEQDELPLLPDHDFPHLNLTWRVRVP